jgi:hypothetical protein
MSLLYHPRGSTVIRATCWIMVAAVFVATALALTLVVSSATWQVLDGQTRGSLVGGIVGGLIGGLLQWSLIIFLFRKRLKQKNSNKGWQQIQ